MRRLARFASRVPAAALAAVCVIVITTDSLRAQDRGGAAAPVLPSRASAAPSTASAPSLDEQEQFLLKARVIRARGINIGVTGTTRLTLTDGRLTHDGQYGANSGASAEWGAAALGRAPW